jgi:hypothetical protein
MAYLAAGNLNEASVSGSQTALVGYLADRNSMALTLCASRPRGSRRTHPERALSLHPPLTHLKKEPTEGQKFLSFYF